MKVRERNTLIKLPIVCPPLLALLMLNPILIRLSARLSEKNIMTAIRKAVIVFLSLSLVKVYQRIPKESRKSSTSFVMGGGA